MLENSSLNALKAKKNLLAFSGGVDSSALFFLLLKHDIKFDIAIVNYNIREQAKEEITYAKELAHIHNSTCHIYNAPKIDKNFEAKAREIRYDFFEDLIKEFKYDNLITAHHLGDRFEWLLMQFCKGAGCIELAGMSEIEFRQGYTLIRPLLHIDKSQLLKYLNLNDIKYFEDKTNLDESITRNSFRHKYAIPLLQKHLEGIKKSFEYLDEDKKSLIQKIKLFKHGEFCYFKSSKNKRADIFEIDKYLKSKSHMPTSSERELLKTQKTVVLGRKFLVVQDLEYVFISPFLQNDETDFHMPKEFKEVCRKLKIEPKLRYFLYKNKDVFNIINSLMIE